MQSKAPWISLSIVAAMTAWSSASLASAGSGVCTIPKTDKEKENASYKGCLTQPGLKVGERSAPDLTAEDILRGPVNSPQFASSDNVFCKYTPHPKSQNSPKFRCYLANEKGQLYSEDLVLVPGAAKVGQEETEDEGYLLNSAGHRINEKGVELTAGQDPIKGYEIKVKYFTGGSQNGDHFEGAKVLTKEREREMFTETASTRLFWALGFAADQMYLVNSVTCFECTSDPFNQKSPAIGKTSTFYSPAIEIKYPGKRIAKEFEFSELTTAVQSNADLKAQVGSYVLALHLINYFNIIPQQNEVRCEKADIVRDPVTKIKSCTAPVFYVQDAGSSWGGKGLIQNPRGEFKKFEYGKNEVFKDPKKCELAITKAGIKQVSRLALQDFQKRLQSLTDEKIQAVITSARMYANDVSLARQKGGAEAMNRLWAAELKKRVEEARHADPANCPN